MTTPPDSNFAANVRMPDCSEMQSLRERFGEVFSKAALVVEAVREESAASRAGLREGDDIYQVNGPHLIPDNIVPAYAIRVLDRYAARSKGEKIKVTVLRDGKQIPLTFTVQPGDFGLVWTRPEQACQPPAEEQQEEERYGISPYAGLDLFIAGNPGGGNATAHFMTYVIGFLGGFSFREPGYHLRVGGSMSPLQAALGRPTLSADATLLFSVWEIVPSTTLDVGLHLKAGGYLDFGPAVGSDLKPVDPGLYSIGWFALAGPSFALDNPRTSGGQEISLGAGLFYEHLLRRQGTCQEYSDGKTAGIACGFVTDRSSFIISMRIAFYSDLDRIFGRSH